MKLIDKGTLVAEIENLVNTYKKCPTRNSYEEGLKDGRLIGYEDALHKINTLEVKEAGLNYNKKTAILSSSHQEVARLFVNSLDWVYGMANPKAEDLLKVIDITGKVYWCDEIEFIENE